MYYHFIKKMPIPRRREPPSSRKRNFFVRLFWDLPKRFVLDRLTQDPDRYNNTAIIIFEGEQGSGKTIAAVQYIYEELRKYPLAQFSANIDVKGQTDLLQDIDQIINSDNGIFGQLNLLDETQNWFNSNESKNVPIEFVGELCQQRKQAKAIIGTTQRFNRLSKQLRQETMYLMRPITVLGCLTIVRKYKPNVDSDGVITKNKLLGCYFFVHSDELRNAYDTYAKVKRLTLKGFKPKSERYGEEGESRTAAE
ncbi:MAG: zonular occludens toxin domain-containing protein [Ruminococcus sp.]|nr:zonular occludens toxin domain-containing protein [Ruminococcus sp.]